MPIVICTGSACMEEKTAPTPLVSNPSNSPASILTKYSSIHPPMVV